MCSILKYKSCVGRNFDYEVSYKEEIIGVSNNEYCNQYDIIGIGTGLVRDYPLLYDGMNEKGLVCGGLAFTMNAKYYSYQEEKKNIPSFEFTFQVLANHDSVTGVREWLEDVSIWDEPYSDDMPNSDLHWFVADKDEAIIVEQTENGINWYDAETGVMTNNPPYPMQLANYNTEKEYVGCCVAYNSKEWFTRGMETDNLQGGYTSEERFIRLSYLKEKLEQSESPYDDFIETFHLLSSVEQLYGATPVGGKYEHTLYSVVYDMHDLKMMVKRYDTVRPFNCAMSTVTGRIPL